jgi:hypothetical protein
MVGNRNHGHAIAFGLKDDSVRKSLHAGLPIDTVQTGEPLRIACHSTETTVYFVTEPHGRRFASCSVPIEGSVEVRPRAGEKHNLFHQSP